MLYTIVSIVQNTMTDHNTLDNAGATLGNNNPLVYSSTTVTRITYCSRLVSCPESESWSGHIGCVPLTNDTATEHTWPAILTPNLETQ